MKAIKPIYRLPELQDHQEWACEGGCDDVDPHLYANVYKQVWNKDTGQLIESHAEHYYHCYACTGLLFVWNAQDNHYVVLPDEAYTPHDNPHNVTLEYVDEGLAYFKKCAAEYSALGDSGFIFKRATLELMKGEKVLLNITSDYLNEIRALLTAHQYHESIA